MKVITAEQGSQEWFLARLGIPTGSGYASLLAKGEGKTRKAYALKLALELVNGVVQSSFKSKPMLDGTEREPDARGMYISRTGNLVDQIGFCRHDTIPTGVSPDGLIDDDGMVEIKCPNPETHRAYMDRETEPSAYKAQIQGQLWVCGRQWCDFVSYHPEYPSNARLVIRRVVRDEDYIRNLEASILQFNMEVQAEAASIKSYTDSVFNTTL